jgi:hypothetical protein
MTAVKRDRDAQLRQLADQAHGADLDLGASLLNGLSARHRPPVLLRLDVPSHGQPGADEEAAPPVPHPRAARGVAAVAHRGHIWDTTFGGRRQSGDQKLFLCRKFTMPEEGLEPPTRGL